MLTKFLFATSIVFAALAAGFSVAADRATYGEACASLASDPDLCPDTHSQPRLGLDDFAALVRDRDLQD